jgi:formate-dependent nitrite reductase membrane component NrfD
MPANPLTDPNWADETTDTVVRLVGTVREKTTTPVVYAARGAVFGLLAVFLGLLAVVLLLITSTRMIQAALEPVTNQARAVYISYFIVGGILVLVGLFLFRKRNAGPSVEG